ncbi:Holliday junction branch migration protein RuvA [Marinicella sp. S1101]|uniref:Holliday junction branch migration protein RuvA n=1 Tax=Marinicella marina TaxID=2996016 RepID=UPI002260A016|nr:Holliday junction branch migration protein RuvA [Marinicella marina]MCX7553179.1 Holliday junction branch migration protein RuvA [Marinicella marina]MDJ1138911.1 Holliday junction branch migration protein RuvA [Marinicella marina]
MIGRLQGTLVHVDPPAHLIVDVSGVGYEVEVPTSVFFELPEINHQMTLVIHHLVREDASILYGFRSFAQRDLFRTLLKVNGIGAKSALAILSTMSSAEFAQVIQEQNVTAIVKVPGIGKKTAQRLIIEMKDKVDVSSMDAGDPNQPQASRFGILAEAESALQALGFKPTEAVQMVKQVAKDDMSAEEIIRLCLQAKGAG